MIFKLSKCSFLIPITVIVAVLFGILYLFVPVYGDDLWYLIRAKDSLHDPWRACMLTYEEVVRHLDFDTGRLSNLLSPPWLCLLPRWMFAAVNGVIIYYALRFGYRIVGGTNDSIRKFLFLFLFVVVLPWFDYMLTTMFTINYLWSTLAVLMVMCYFLRLADAASLSRVEYLLILAVCFMTGWMHEGASVPLSMAIFMYLLIDRKTVTGYVLTSYICLLAGVVTLISFPAIWHRSSEGAFKLFSHPLNEALLSVLVFNCMFYIYCILLIYVLIKRRIVSVRDKATAVFYLTFGLSSTLIFIFFYGGPRVGWFNQLVSGIGTLWLIGLFPSRYTSKILKSSLKVLLSAFLILHLVFAIVRQSELKNEFDDVVRQIETVTDATVYYDIMKPKVDLSLFKTSIRGLNERMPLEQLGAFYCDDKQLRILPSDLMDFSPQSFKGKDIAIYKDKYIVTNSLPADENIINVMTDGRWVESRFRAVVLFAPSQGDTLLWIVPHIQTMSPGISIEGACWRLP